MSTASPVKGCAPALKRQWAISVRLGATCALTALLLLLNANLETAWAPLNNLIITLVLGVWISCSDITTRLIPNAATPTLTLLYTATFVIAWTQGWFTSADALRTLSASAVVGTIYALLFLVDGTSPGDVKLAALLTLAVGGFGWAPILTAAVVPYLLALPEALLRAIRRKRAPGIPFGPYLVAGAALALGGVLLGWQ